MSTSPTSIRHNDNNNSSNYNYNYDYNCDYNCDCDRDYDCGYDDEDDSYDYACDCDYDYSLGFDDDHASSQSGQPKRRLTLRQQHHLRGRMGARAVWHCEAPQKTSGGGIGILAKRAAQLAAERRPPAQGEVAIGAAAATGVANEKVGDRRLPSRLPALGEVLRVTHGCGEACPARAQGASV